MDEEKTQDKTNLPKKRNVLGGFDNIIKKFIPNFNVRAILYITLIFAVVMYLEIWHISSPTPKTSVNTGKQETVVADQKYWDSQTYKNKIKNQTLESFTAEFQSWLNGQSQEFTTRKFEDMFYINSALTPSTGGDLATVIPENFNYLENAGKARYLYAKTKGFLNDQPATVHLGNVSCDINDNTEQATNIELYDWQYASIPKLSAFMNSNPDWKMQIGDKIYNVQDPIMPGTAEGVYKQRVGLFSFLIFHYPKTNQFVLANSEILDNNGIDGYKTLLGIEASQGKKLSKLDFKAGFNGCNQINNPVTSQDYGQPD